jgi:Putative Ig domain
VSGLKRSRTTIPAALAWVALGIVAAITVGCGGGGGSTAAAGQSPVGSAPTISGTPSTTAQVGVAYSFTPTASDNNGDALTYSISNKPSWATFNTLTGKLAGTPATGNIGTNSGIVIGVSNGAANDFLPAFSISVAAGSNPPATGSATVSWTEPTRNTDGSAADVAGYRVYYGTSSTDLSQSLDVSDPTQLSQLIGNLSSATWYFAVAAVNSAGVESARSGPVSKAVS